MTLAEFLALDDMSRLRTVARAVCVAGREENWFKVLLFQLGDFYVEIYYDKHGHFISQVSGFDDTERLEPYLQKIELDGLVAT